MAFTQEKRERIAEAIRSKGALKECERCGNRNFTVLDGYFRQEAQDDIHNVTLGGPSIPTYGIVCNNCGNISFLQLKHYFLMSFKSMKKYPAHSESGFILEIFSKRLFTRNFISFNSLSKESYPAIFKCFFINSISFSVFFIFSFAILNALNFFSISSPFFNSSGLKVYSLVFLCSLSKLRLSSSLMFFIFRI